MIEDYDESGQVPPKPQKEKSAYITLEDLERMQNRRIRSRVAARNARHRRKARVQGLEQDVKELLRKNKSLSSECAGLRDRNRKLKSENAELQDKLSNPLPDNLLQVSSSSCGSELSEERVEVALSAENLVTLWEQVSSFKIPECDCSMLPQNNRSQEQKIADD